MTSAGCPLENNPAGTWHSSAEVARAGRVYFESGVMEESVEFRQIPDYPDYQVGSDGSIWSHRRGKWKRLKGWKELSNHLKVTLHNDPLHRLVFIHHLVLEAFVGPRPQGMETRHLDGNPENNAITNLVWGTRKENVADAVHHGTAVIGHRGQDHNQAILTDHSVIEARRLRRSGIPLSKLSSRFGVHSATLQSAICGKSWSHIPGAVPSRKAKALNLESVKRIKQMLRDGVPVKVIADRFHRKNNVIYCIKCGKSYPNVT